MSTQTPQWTEERIRQELASLDTLVLKKKGIQLEGSTMPIKFTHGTQRLGSFYYSNHKMGFTFSRLFFNDPTTPEAAAIDVIRHEFAHYYAYVVFAKTGHDRWWRAACEIVGANPKRLYTPEYYHELEEKERNKDKLFRSQFKEGCIAYHKQYGSGVVEAVQALKNTAVITVRFNSGETKRIDEKWLVLTAKGVSIRA